MNPCPHNAIWFHPVSNCPFHKPPNVQTSNDTRPATVRPLQSHPVNAEVLQEAQGVNVRVDPCADSFQVGCFTLHKGLSPALSKFTYICL